MLTLMKADETTLEAMRQRRSWRSFDGQQIPETTRAELQALLDAPPPGPFGGSVRLGLVAADAEQRSGAKLGTYGVVKGAPLFMAGVIDNEGHALEDYGYIFEWALLHATRLGLCSCWLGGTFKRASFGLALNAGPSEIVPAIAPLGFPKRHRTIVDTVFRWGAGSKKRKPWSDLFFDASMQPLKQDEGCELSTAFEMVRLAPSASNHQPWRLLRERSESDGTDNIHLFMARKPGYQQRFPVDLQRIDMGIAMCHFDLATRALGHFGRWQATPEQVHQTPPNASYVASWSADTV